MALRALGWDAYFLGQIRLLQNVPVAVPAEVTLADAFSFALPILIFALYRVIYPKPLKQLQKSDIGSPANESVTDNSLPEASSDATSIHANGLLTVASLFLAIVSIVVPLASSQGKVAPSGYLLVIFVLIAASVPSLIVACISWVNPSPSKEFVKLQSLFVGAHLAVVLLWIAYIFLAT